VLGGELGALPTILWDQWDKKTRFFKNEPEKLLILNRNCPKTNRNQAKNEAEKLKKTLECIENEPENQPGHVLENKRPPKIDPLTK
jgi:hypothetical protein